MPGRADPPPCAAQGGHVSIEAQKTPRKREGPEDFVRSNDGPRPRWQIEEEDDDKGTKQELRQES